MTNLAIKLLLIGGSLALSSLGARAEDVVKKPHIPLQKTIGEVTATAPVPSLAVINSNGAKLEGGKLILTGVSTNAIVFADRPVRAAGHVTTEQFIMQWDEGKNNFAIDPPNATVSVLGGDGSDVDDAVVTLKKPTLQGTTLTFDVDVLEGQLSGGSGPTAVFIDAFAVRGRYGGGFAHVGGYGDAWRGGGAWHGGGAYWHAPVYHGAWYGAGAVAGAAVVGAAVGAAVADPYYAPPPPACGYYPYPPCY
ncbi:hypothetical protein GCM10007874_36890 [Labrys miyagiensis]|uniref:DUF5666 domain-containing protein n=2 Tax=Labrys miyagiensis TaxID=346912 RepID=A0ABQ6CJY4_9HYPH|nr:hypothetical protein [Labrys miyagiensis]GLS20672.1 hypothetical protein GCM10007874_36890 [Labrys miyagiensis]